MSPLYTNHLKDETSPYLLQHAHNPVDWYPWGDTALQKAKKEDKPILISIGYAACHWCHVMERESFEDAETAELMNRNFVNIKVDREERPDLDHLYMDAVQAITGSGGWPLNVFLTPEGKPFFGGTYFPPLSARNRIGWKELLQEIHKTFLQDRETIEKQAENLTRHIGSVHLFSKDKAGEAAKSFSPENIEEIQAAILKTADLQWGGFGHAPKFPQTFLIRFLLRHYYFTGTEASVRHACLSLDKMLQGGIYDQVGGGFARYSTDQEWFAPHFEKMLYDNALLLGVLAESYQLTREKNYVNAAMEILAFLKNEMLSPGGGFYSALDADSEGEEGKFYTWGKQELNQLLGADSAVYCRVYGVTDTGNWEHTNILWLPETIEQVATELKQDPDQLRLLLEDCNRRLREKRSRRIRPALDDKILLGWNALTLTACCKAYAAFGKKDFLELALTGIEFLENNLRNASGEWKHTWKAGKASYPAYLDDYSFLIQAYIQLQEVTGRQDFLLKARDLTREVLVSFSDEATGYFYFTPAFQQDILLRKLELYDGATPSGNAVMAENLAYLSVIFDQAGWKIRSEKMVMGLQQAIGGYPASFGEWANLLFIQVYGQNEIAITGPEAGQRLKEINAYFMPGRVIQSAAAPRPEFPLLQGKFSREGKTEIFLCKQYTCQKPVENTDQLLKLIIPG